MCVWIVLTSYIIPQEALKAVEETQAEIIPPEVAVAQVPLSANKILSEGVQVTKATVSISGEIQVVMT